MPLPNGAATVTGGCSCGAVRYRIAIPKLDDRPLHPMSPPDVASRLPDTITCQCNDCRRSTGSFLAIGLIDVPAPMLTVSVIPQDSESTIASGRIVDVLACDYDAAEADTKRPPYVPATDAFRATEESKSWLRFFHTTNADESWSRSFCGRCGSHVCFHFKLMPEYCHGGKLPDGWQDVFHLYLGGVDREFLEKDWFTPSVEVMFKNGTPFSRCVSATAKGLRNVSKVQEFDGEVTDEELAKFRA
ncbi:hypothetical protein IWW34DRAFT_753560 [Fusarium oxysporum f. sp. albedinis]|nr:hypothetical protein IWW34DRAFT_753560 [Fusarium oxysporum f. sp. albedinis]KAK2471182.1 hypothetical protein H9L39_17413 [Fusarium oxysporum f. sp. albedinis]